MMGMRPEPYTMAFGGVETGNMNAQEAATVVGISNSKGCASIAWDRLAIIGSDSEIVAVLEATSVKPVIIPTVLTTITNGLASPSQVCNWAAI